MLLLPIFGVCSKPSVDCPVVVIDCPGPTVSCPQPGNLEPGISSDPLHQPGGHQEYFIKERQTCFWIYSLGEYCTFRICQVLNRPL